MTGCDFMGGSVMMGWFWLFWILLFALVIGLLVAVVVLLIRRPDVSSAPAAASIHGGESPLEILKRRYAKGEIGSNDFERIRR